MVFSLTKEIKTCAQAGKGFVIRLGVNMCVRACDLNVCMFVCVHVTCVCVCVCVCEFVCAKIFCTKELGI